MNEGKSGHMSRELTIHYKTIGFFAPMFKQSLQYSLLSVRNYRLRRYV